ncbi:MAG: peptide deformylase [Myxococcales bacterium]|nr:peptide deformylase [Myxococcales bacterium]MCB9549654.1 peptide deformylase [Myxococcales bacterium]
MAVLPILSIGDPVLREVSRAVSAEELATPALQAFIDDLIETMHAAHGAGLAAPQVGRPVRICAVHIQQNPRYPYKPDFPLTVFVNPTLTRLSGEEESVYEGCLSVPDLRGRVQRAMHVRVDAWDRHGAPFTLEARGLIAGTFQHEFDHLDGLLFVDRVTDPRTLCTWAAFDRFYREAFVAEAMDINRKYVI